MNNQLDEIKCKAAQMIDINEIAIIASETYLTYDEVEGIHHFCSGDIEATRKAVSIIVGCDEGWPCSKAVKREITWLLFSLKEKEEKAKAEVVERTPSMTAVSRIFKAIFD